MSLKNSIVKMINSKKIKNIIKFQIESDSLTLNPKISTVLGQRRINSSEFFDFFKTKLSELKIKKEIKLLLKVFILIFDLDDYSVYIKMPSISSLVNHFFYINKNFHCPGYFFGQHIKNKLNINFNYILTPYVLYEIIKYKYSYENIDGSYLYSNYKKVISSLKSKGINLLYLY